MPSDSEYCLVSRPSPNEVCKDARTHDRSANISTGAIVIIVKATMYHEEPSMTSGAQLQHPDS